MDMVMVMVIPVLAFISMRRFTLFRPLIIRVITHSPTIIRQPW
jgi:hypothetical protein